MEVVVIAYRLAAAATALALSALAPAAGPKRISCRGPVAGKATP